MANTQANQDAMKRLFQGNPQNPLYGDTPPPDPSQPMPPTNAQPLASTAPQPTPQPQAAPAPGEISAAMKPPTEAPPMPATSFSGNAPIANAPTPFHHGKLASILLGVGEALGNPLASHIGERDRARQGEVDEYTRNQPATQFKANQAAQLEAANISHTGAQTEEAQADTGLKKQEAENLRMTPPGKAEFLKELQQRRSSGTDDPQRLFDEYAVRAPYAHTTRQEVLDVIKNTPVQPFNFKTSEGAIQPGGYLGSTYGPDPSPNEPAEVGAARKNAMASIKQGQTGKIAVAKEEAKAKQAIIAGNLGQQGDPMIDMVGQGRVDLATALQRIPPQAKETFMSTLSAKYPGFNQSTYGISKDVGEAFTSGDQGKQLTAISTAREHMQTFKQLADALDNNNIQVLNQIGNAFGVQFGNDKATNFKIAAQAFGGEVGKAFDGAGVTEGERKSAQGAFNPNMSPEQFRGAIKTVDSLLAGKQKALQQSYQSGRQGNPNFGQQGGKTTPSDPLGIR